MTVLATFVWTSHTEAAANGSLSSQNPQVDLDENFQVELAVSAVSPAKPTAASVKPLESAAEIPTMSSEPVPSSATSSSLSATFLTSSTSAGLAQPSASVTGQEGTSGKTEPLDEDSQRLVLTAKELLRKYARLTEEPLGRGDIAGLAEQCYLYRQLFELCYDATGRRRTSMDRILGDSNLYHQVEVTLQNLEYSLFPFVNATEKYKNVANVLQSYQDQRGLVISTGSWHFRFARHLIHVVREVLNSTLPIEVFYSGPGDLGQDQINYLRTIDNVRVVDLQQHFDTAGPGVRGWAVKPFAMLASSFSEIIFVDADANFFQDPEVVFKDSGYVKTGALLYRDRTINVGGESNQSKYVKKLITNPSDYAKASNRLFSLKSVHEGESGVVVLNKAKVFHVLLLICKMNSEYFRGDTADGKKDGFWGVFHGDKETFWMAFELMKQPYWMNAVAGGTVGFVSETDGVCGGLFHVDEHQKPLWFNGGVVINKYHAEGDKTTLQLTDYAFDTTYEKVKWAWERKDRPFCLLPRYPNEQGKLEGKYKEAADGIIRVWGELLDRPITS
ncbi:mannosyltransferase putative-domain-containing protein [Polychytrium aggregatum]|uniref:mannosyltransferase putative-domain-containing protein n=1 Tax=Polychytrium aggregatum TaxID=110093 RepID=UPI0022FE5236|nr:mannosyltransferase putative-domain-containing protein [Polychytrium aggregatum]KAI9197056.1 mannosyltransferase putative-domain-containing protein [Polychytrium aggregatum]